MNREIRVINDNAHVTTTQYDVWGRVIKTTDAKGSHTDTTYDKNGHVIKKETTELGDLPSVTYEVTQENDAVNRAKKNIRELGGNTRKTFDGLGNVVRSVNSKFEGKHYRYDHHGRQYSDTFLKNRTFEAYVRNEDFDPVWVGQDFATSGLSLGERRWILEYTCYTTHDSACRGYDVPADVTVWYASEYSDEDHELLYLDWWAVPFRKSTGLECTSSTCPGVSRVHYSTGYGSLPEETDTVAWQPMTAFTVMGPYGPATSQAYDQNGNVVSQTDGLDQTTYYDFDALNRKIKVMYADNSFDSFLFNPGGQLVGMTDARGVNVTNSYDPLGRLLLVEADITGTTAIGTTRQEFTYDPLGRRTSAKDITASPASVQETTFRYDSLGNVIQETQNGIAVESVRDGVGNRLVLKYPNGAEVRSTYDELERLRNVKDESGLQLAKFLYMGASRVVGRENGNGIETTMEYNADGLLTAIRHKLGASVKAGWTYEVDQEGARRSMMDLVDSAYSADYTMDHFWRLQNYTRADFAENWTLDDANNWAAYEKDDAGTVTTESRTHDSTNFLTDRDSTDYGRDDVGNLVDDGTYLYKWDFKNRLREVRNKATGTLRAEFFYDADYRRLAKVDHTGSFAKTTLYVLDGNREIIEETWIAPALTASSSRTYVYGLQADEIVVMQIRNSLSNLTTLITASTHWYHQDDVDSLILVTDGSGTPTERYAFNPYGARQEILVPAGGSFERRYFTGRNYDDETGLDYYRSRYYSSEYGRFINRDTIGIWGDTKARGNAYAYVSCEPVGKNDPTGKWEEYEDCSWWDAPCQARNAGRWVRNHAEELKCIGFAILAVAGIAILIAMTGGSAAALFTVLGAAWEVGGLALVLSTLGTMLGGITVAAVQAAIPAAILAALPGLLLCFLGLPGLLKYFL